ncbi:hypothetical protein [Pedobacter mendelii]|uniref:Uncharacterized protein n=1 Tax=Pedobacter mendelii TaxID=1908240 RepID=A0ABQ2BQH1_9SPHI|nr:hypothetical protein [Pedobacter mendelii]GGI29058.1 hypothetical protein GCM10008119_35740 [Pedobacter mendelii]
MKTPITCDNKSLNPITKRITRLINNGDDLNATAMKHIQIAYSILIKDLEIKGISDQIIEYWAIEKLINIYTLRQ